jgi:hypothetical protein
MMARQRSWALNPENTGLLTKPQPKQIEALTAGLQKVSAQLEVIKPAPQTVQNSP